MSDIPHEGEQPVLTFDVIPTTPEETARALRQMAWKYGYLKLHRLGAGHEVILELVESDEPDVPHVIDPKATTEPGDTARDEG